MWLDDLGMGYLPVTACPYDEAYFAKYQGYAQTIMGHALNDVRLQLVARHWDGMLLDVGIGCGQFVESRPGTLGYDINPAGVRWLEERSLLRDPREEPVDAACFWDALEHIADPVAILNNVRHRVFVALPIFTDLEHVLRSKHFRPDEHCWYFTELAFIACMQWNGWELLEVNDQETQLGREDIKSYAFKRA